MDSSRVKAKVGGWNTRVAFVAVLGLVLMAVILSTSHLRKATSEPIPDRKSDLVVVAHGDDWQIFAGDLVWKYLGRGDEVTFVQITIGVGDYKCWERGFIASVVTAIDNSPKSLSCDAGSDLPAGCRCADFTFPNEHTVKRCTYGNSAMYFFHLPATNCPFCGHQLDGVDLDGKTLLNFYLGRNQPLSAKDSPPSASYADWSDLVGTISWAYQTHFLVDDKGHPLVKSYGDILSVEPHGVVRVFPTGGYPTVSTDHLDHGLAGCAALDVYRGMFAQVANPGLILFRGYDSILIPPNVRWDNGQAQEKMILFDYAFGQTIKGNALGPNGTSDDFYQERLLRTIIEEQIDSGSGRPHEGCEWLATIGFPN